LIRVRDEAIAIEGDAKLRAYFADDYVFDGPGGDLVIDELRERPFPLTSTESLPTRQYLEWEAIGTFRYNDDGRLAEEWVPTTTAASSPSSV